MILTFYKYEGTGNDFVMIDNRTNIFPKNDTKLVAHLCDRHFGIGADGLILLENDENQNFSMVYYNSDGNPSSMCGNGGRCLAAFAKQLGIITDKAIFSAVDGLHFALIDECNIVSLQMIDVECVKKEENYTFLNTGSPHHIEMTTDIERLNVKEEGAKIRYSDLYGKEGSNVNFVSPLGNNVFAVRTYERGVEDETLSCGTGATAAAIAMFHNGKATENQIKIKVQGGDLDVRFTPQNGSYTNVFLIGKATFVFKGEINIE